MTYVISDGKEDTNPVIQELFNNMRRRRWEQQQQ
jgi:hypothetical protein